MVLHIGGKSRNFADRSIKYATRIESAATNANIYKEHDQRHFPTPFLLLLLFTNFLFIALCSMKSLGIRGRTPPPSTNVHKHKARQSHAHTGMVDRHLTNYTTQVNLSVSSDETPSFVQFRRSNGLKRSKVRSAFEKISTGLTRAKTLWKLFAKREHRAVKVARNGASAIKHNSRASVTKASAFLRKHKLLWPKGQSKRALIRDSYLRTSAHLRQKRNGKSKREFILSFFEYSVCTPVIKSPCSLDCGPAASHGENGTGPRQVPKEILPQLVSPVPPLVTVTTVGLFSKANHFLLFMRLVQISKNIKKIAVVPMVIEEKEEGPAVFFPCPDFRFPSLVYTSVCVPEALLPAYCRAPVVPAVELPAPVAEVKAIFSLKHPIFKAFQKKAVVSEPTSVEEVDDYDATVAFDVVYTDPKQSAVVAEFNTARVIGNCKSFLLRLDKQRREHISYPGTIQDL